MNLSKECLSRSGGCEEPSEDLEKLKKENVGLREEWWELLEDYEKLAEQCTNLRKELKELGDSYEELKKENQSLNARILSIIKDNPIMSSDRKLHLLGFPLYHPPEETGSLSNLSELSSLPANNTSDEPLDLNEEHVNLQNEDTDLQQEHAKRSEIYYNLSCWVEDSQKLENVDENFKEWGKRLQEYSKDFEEHFAVVQNDSKFQQQAAFLVENYSTALQKLVYLVNSDNTSKEESDEEFKHIRETLSNLNKLKMDLSDALLDLYESSTGMECKEPIPAEELENYHEGNFNKSGEMASPFENTRPKSLDQHVNSQNESTGPKKQHAEQSRQLNKRPLDLKKSLADLAERYKDSE